MWSRRELELAGYTRRSIERTVASGAILRVRSGWYASPDTPEAIVTAVAAGGRVSCVSAARMHGLWIPPGCDESLHISLPRNGPRAPSGLTAHWSDPPGQSPRHPLASVVDALLVAATCVSPEDAFVLVESAMHQGLVGVTGWRRAIAGLPAALRIELGQAGPLSASGTESRFVRRIRRMGIGVRQQVKIGPDRVDAVLDDGQAVELDSREYHDARRDSRRDARVGIAGHDTLRFSYEQVWFDWPTVEAAVLAARARRSARPRIRIGRDLRGA